MAALGELHRSAVEHWLGVAARVPDDAWDDPTPCTEWSVRALVNHVVYEDLWTVPLFRGATIQEVGDRFDGDVLGDMPKAAADRAAREAVAVVAELLPSGGTVQLSFGETSMEEYAAQLAADHVIHAWDLAVAIGLDRTIPEDLLGPLAEWFADREEGYRSGGVIGPRAASTGGRQGDLLAAFGRDPGWVSPAS